VTYSPITNTERNNAHSGALLHWPSDVSITFPGIPATLCAVRKVVADTLGDSPRSDDLILVACEYATNAIRHSPSGLPGGVFTLRMWVRAGWARLEVTDSGAGDWAAPDLDSADFDSGDFDSGDPDSADPDSADLDSEGGRGLMVVAQVADSSGHVGCCSWAEVSWTEPSLD
jgi:anti-sigma regulatory factor (Ser/Thr protein kinase)